MRQAIEQASQGFAFFKGKGKMAEMRCRWGVYIDFSGVYRYYKPMRSRKKTGGSARIILGENGLIIGGITCGKLWRTSGAGGWHNGTSGEKIPVFPENNMNKKDPLITIITPAYNRSECMKKCWESLCQQSFTAFQWLIIDDGSVDETEKLVSKWKSDRNNFQIE